MPVEKHAIIRVTGGIFCINVKSAIRQYFRQDSIRMHFKAQGGNVQMFLNAGYVLVPEHIFRETNMNSDVARCLQ